MLADDLRRFERELDALEALDHPAVVALRGHGVHDGHPFLVLERCDGGCLATVLADGPLGPDRAAELGADLAEGLAHAHARGVVHRDVKPANVLLVEDGTPKLADFGIARLSDSSALTGTGFTIGTAAYLAPEQAKGETVGPEADVYSLGLVVLEAATGRRAFDGVGLAAAMARLQHPPEIPESLPSDLAATVAAMTAMEPADRPTAAEVSAALRPHATADPDAGATAVLPILDEPTTIIPAVVAAAPRAWPRWAMPAACFVAGFLAVAVHRHRPRGRRWRWGTADDNDDARPDHDRHDRGTDHGAAASPGRRRGARERQRQRPWWRSGQRQRRLTATAPRRWPSASRPGPASR